MNLLYIWNAQYSMAKLNDGYLLSSRYEITFDKENSRLSIQCRKSLSTNGFWGEHIYDVMAVVGRNGAGKTQLAYSIMNTLDEACRLSEDSSGSQASHFPFLLVFEDSGRDSKLIIIAADIPKPEIVFDPKYCRYNIPCDYFSFTYPNKNGSYSLRCDLKRFKFAYFTDALSLTDYRQKKYGVVYDGSLGGGIRQAFEFNQGMHYIDRTISPIINYFDDEMDRILKFVCSEQNKTGIPFSLPQWITFSLKDYDVNLDYILQELSQMKILEGKDILKKKCNEMRERYGWDMKSKLAIHIMLNLFKAYCIPQTSADHLQGIAQVFLKKISQMECFVADPFDSVLKLMEEIKPELDDSEFLVYCQDMLQWVKEQPVLQKSGSRDTWMLNLVKEAKIVEGLYYRYEKTKFPFPFLSISFGLNTGEYAFLRRFVRINELLKKNLNGHVYVTNNLNCETHCDSLMLYFDEADQSLHPEWQRKQLDWLLQFISARFKTCMVQLIIATHSPIILSDIPRGHVLYLENDEQVIHMKQQKIRTFGNNIHTLFRDAFFLSKGTMGSFAERKINEIAQSLQGFKEQVPEDIYNIVEEIGDDVIRNKLWQMCRIRQPKVHQTDREVTEKTICLLRSQVKQIEATIRELERIRYD